MQHPYVPMSQRPRLQWPGGAQVGVIVTINFEYWDPAMEQSEGKIQYEGGLPLMPMPMPFTVPNYVNYTWRHYGHRVGIWRLMALLDRLNIRASATLNIAAAEHYPQAIQAMKERKWEFIAHSNKQTDLLLNFYGKPEAERAFIRMVLSRFREEIGHPAEGWLSPSTQCTNRTVEFLMDEGLRWFCDFNDEDVPYLLPDPTGRGRRLVAIPYNLEINDYTIFMRRDHTPDEFATAIIEEYEVLRDEAAASGSGVLMSIGLHPHVIGRPHRVRSLQRALSHIIAAGGAWFPSRGEVARLFLEQTGG